MPGEKSVTIGFEWGEMMEIKDKIKLNRQRKNITQKELSDLTGISISSIQKYETGERVPGREALSKIEKVLGYSSDIIRKTIFYMSRLNDADRERVAQYAKMLHHVEKNRKR